jgi:hypothetical protein
MHFILFVYTLCVCVYMILFIYWLMHLFHIYPLFMFIFIYLFVLTFLLFFLMTRVLSIVSSVATPFQNKCVNCHVGDVIISSINNVHYNPCHSKSVILKSIFFIVPLQPMMNLCYWLLNANVLKQLCIWQNLNSSICFIQNKFNSSF